MYDLIMDIFHTLMKNGLTLSSLGAVVFLILKQRKMKRRMRKYLPWIFSDDPDVSEYVGNQKIIMANQQRIMDHLGVEPCGDTRIYRKVDQTNSNTLLLSCLTTHRREEKRRNVIMNWIKNVNKAILVPFLSAIALFVKQVSGYEIPDEWIDAGANFVLLLVMFIGLFIKPKKDNSELPKNDQYYH